MTSSLTLDCGGMVLRVKEASDEVGERCTEVGLVLGGLMVVEREGKVADSIEF